MTGNVDPAAEHVGHFRIPKAVDNDEVFVPFVLVLDQQLIEAVAQVILELLAELAKFKPKAQKPKEPDGK